MSLFPVFLSVLIFYDHTTHTIVHAAILLTIILQAFFFKLRNLLLYAFNILDNVTHTFLVKVQSACKLVEDTDIVNDKSVGLISVYAVGTANCLKKRMVRLIRQCIATHS